MKRFPYSVAALSALVLTASAAVPTARPFGKLADGTAASLWRIEGAGGLVLDVSDYGGRLVRLYAPDRYGNLADVTLGWNTVGEYEAQGFSMSTLIGRFGNRIADGRFTLDGREYRLPVNETKPAPRHCNLHSGPVGWDAKVWQAEPFERGTERGVSFSLVSPDGDMGFPGTVRAKVVYTVTADNVWRLDYEAVTDRPTVINLTHHSYWNLAGEASGSVNGQLLMIAADRFTKTDDGLIPLADEPVEGTGFDFRSLRPIGARADWMAAQPWLKCTDNWYDHNFVLRGAAGEMKLAAVMKDPVSGRRLEITTTEPCLQVYGAQNLDGTFAAKTAGARYERFAGIALETQHYPDSPNHPEFPSTVLRPGETFRSTTSYRFTAE